MEENQNSTGGQNIGYIMTMTPPIGDITITTKVDVLLNIYEVFKDEEYKYTDLKELVVDKLEKIVEKL